MDFCSEKLGAVKKKMAYNQAIYTLLLDLPQHILLNIDNTISYQSKMDTEF